LLGLLSGPSSRGFASAVDRLPRPVATEVHREFLGQDFHLLVKCAFHGAQKRFEGGTPLACETRLAAGQQERIGFWRHVGAGRKTGSAGPQAAG